MNKKNTVYGGQALIEGVMIRGPAHYAIAVRRQNGSIFIQSKKVSAFFQNFSTKFPIIRGIIVLIDMLITGFSALNRSAQIALEDITTEKENTKSQQIFTFLSFAIGLGFGIILFLIIPLGASKLLKFIFDNQIFIHFMEGLIRLLILFIYLLVIGKMPDIKRVFQYHGAEHMVVHSHENKLKLTVKNARKFSTQHPRCGTSFLVIVMIMTILVFTFLPLILPLIHQSNNFIIELIYRILLVPIIGGISYEFIRLFGKNANNSVVKILLIPGLWLQNLTTNQPEDDQIEVALASMNSVLEAEQGNS
tara:strand:+ start:2814 stop:3731 length:918 start_codon:yes stop_codon:yes gene_type:complete